MRTSLWTHEIKEGEDYELFNNLSMFRYNAYFGIHTVHYLDLVMNCGKEKLPLAKIFYASILTKLAKKKNENNEEAEILKPWGLRMFNRLDALCFLCFIKEDGFPWIIPLIQCGTAGSGRLVFSPKAYNNELGLISKDRAVCVFSLTFQMESILVRGRFAGFEKFRNVKLGMIDIDWVYNSMPPVQGQVYPFNELEAVIDF